MVSAKKQRSKAKRASRQTTVIKNVTRPGGMASPGVSGGDAFAPLRAKYALLDKAEWWWLFDDSLAQIGATLCRDNFVVMDNFLGRDKALALHGELRRAYDAGQLPETALSMVGCPRLEPGALAGGKTGTGLTYKMDAVRGDFVAWFSGKEPGCGWQQLPTYLQRVDTLVSELGDHVNDIKDANSMRSNAMATCYPGNGAHYVRHCDNTSSVRNGRRLTALYYANPAWSKGDGGELRIFHPQKIRTEGDKKENIKMAFHQLADVEPVADRLVLFFADERVPHEVLPTFVQRFAVTLWYFDKDEKAEANRLKSISEDAEERRQAEEERIQREIQGFQERFGQQASIVTSGNNAQVQQTQEKEQGQDQDQHAEIDRTEVGEKEAPDSDVDPNDPWALD